MASVIVQYLMKSSIGPLYLVASEESLLGIHWDRQPHVLIQSSREHAIIHQAVTELQEYFSGKRKKFQVPLKMQGTDFQVRVWKQLQKIPYGKTVSYSDIARGIKHDRAVRAVGTANGKNPFSVIVPCHRVIAADGSLGGYAGGLDLKVKLLEIERSY